MKVRFNRQEMADALAAALTWRALNLLIMPPIFLFGWSQRTDGGAFG